ncbi:MAG: hypothetical protein OXI18_11650 [bacterium]|nr:hypothetical protein [bacterium]
MIPQLILTGLLAVTPLINDLFADHADDALAVMDCESSGNPRAVGDDGASIGLFQIAWDNIWGRYEYPEGIREAADVPAGMTIAETKEWLKDPANNVRVAFWTWELRGGWSGWGGWSCSRVL